MKYSSGLHQAYPISNSLFRSPASVQVQQLGYFSDELDAARAYDRTMLELRGPLAVTNFPPSDYDFDDSTWTDTHEEVRPVCASSRAHAHALVRRSSLGERV